MKQNIFLCILGLLIAILSLSSVVIADPAGPKSMDNPMNTTWPVWQYLTHEAIAGNVSELIFNGSTVTRTYQGYVGNITGMIILGDLSNNTLYDWSLASPQGEIYAVRESTTVPVWSSVTCATDVQIAAEDTDLGTDPVIDEDAVNRTFAVGGTPEQRDRFNGGVAYTHPAFFVSNQTVSGCPMASMYDQSGPSTDFKEVLLADNTNPFIIYTAIISHTINPGDTSSVGFNGNVYDFQMIVGEDGHGAQNGPTAETSTYYFYLELD